MKKYSIIIIFLGVIIGLWSILPQAALAQSVCQNECSYYGQHESQGTSGRTCGNYDADACLEWSSLRSCDIQSFYCGDRSCDSQCGETSLNCSTDCAIPNPLPSANAGPDKEIYEGAAVYLEGAVSDPENELLSYKWSCNGGRLSDSNILKPLYYAPENLTESEKIITCTLRAEDKRGALTSDNVFITVNKITVNLDIDQLARNITQKQISWQKNISAVPSDIIEFKVEVTAIKDTVNIFLKEILPQGLSYRGNLKVDGKIVNQNIISNLNIGDLKVDQTKIITFEANILPENNYAIGTTGMTAIVKARANFMTETSEQISINVIKARNALTAVQTGQTERSTSTAEALVKGATLVSTGVTNKIIESLLPPLFVALLIVLAFRSKIIWLDEWLDKRKINIKTYQTETTLKRKISQIKNNDPEIYKTWNKQ